MIRAGLGCDGQAEYGLRTARRGHVIQQISADRWEDRDVSLSELRVMAWLRNMKPGRKLPLPIAWEGGNLHKACYSTLIG